MSSSVKRYLIALKRPGRIPEKKRPVDNTPDGTSNMLRELYACYPDCLCLVMRVTWDDDIWLDDGRTWLAEEELHKQTGRIKL